MKIRTVYFKVAEMGKAVQFWSSFLNLKPTKKLPEWTEFRCDNINFSLLYMPAFTVERDRSNCVPVFEYADDALEAAKSRALGLGATVLIDIADHPDKLSYVLLDPWGNEFEITRLHG